jgi:hypothetical protein
VATIAVLVLEHVVAASPTVSRRAHVELVVGRGVHEDEVVAVVVQVLHLAAVDVGGLDLGVGVERLVDDLAAEHVLELGAHEGVALAGLVVLELDDLSRAGRQIRFRSTMPFLRSLVERTRRRARCRSTGATREGCQTDSAEEPQGAATSQQRVHVVIEAAIQLTRRIVVVIVVGEQGGGDDASAVHEDNHAPGSSEATVHFLWPSCATSQAVRRARPVRPEPRRRLLAHTPRWALRDAPDGRWNRG